MRRDSADVPSEVFAWPGRCPSRSVPPVALADVRGRAVARQSQCTCPSLAFRTFPSCCSPSPAAASRSDAPGARRDSFEIPSRRLPTLASPSASSPSRAGSAHLSMREPCLSWNFVPCRGPISRCLRERLLPEDRDPPSADGRHTVGHAPPSWFFTTSTASSVHGSRHVAAGTGSGFARFSPGRSSKPKLLGPGPGSPLALHPAKVCSSSAAVPHRCGLLPSCRSFRPRPKTKWTLERLDPSLPAPPFPT